jgi:tRNA G18 (ribose-2'-O)-methylase SpoU
MSKEHLPNGSKIVDAIEALQLVSAIAMLEGVSAKLGPIRVPRGIDVLENEGTALLVAHTILGQLVQRFRDNCDFAGTSKHEKKKKKKRAKQNQKAREKEIEESGGKASNAQATKGSPTQADQSISGELPAAPAYAASSTHSCDDYSLLPSMIKGKSDEEITGTLANLKSTSMDFHWVNSADDARVAAYRSNDSVTHSDFQLRDQGLFMAERRIVVRRLLQRSSVVSIITTPAKLAGLLEGIAPVTATKIQVYLTPSLQSIQDILGYTFVVDVVAMARRQEQPALESFFNMEPLPDMNGGRLLLLMDKLSSPDNVGGIMRSALAFGASGALLSPNCADPLCRKALRCSMGASLKVPSYRFPKQEYEAGLLALKEAGYLIVALCLTPSAVEVKEVPMLNEMQRGEGCKIALMVGNEGDGISPETLAFADVHVKISMCSEEDVDSVNVGVCAGISLRDIMWQCRERRDGGGA